MVAESVKLLVRNTRCSPVSGSRNETRRKIKTIESKTLVRANASCWIRHRMGIDAVVLHVDLGPGDKERTGLMDHIKSLEIHVTAIHDVDGAGLGCDQIEGQGITHFTVLNMDKTGYRPAQVEQCVHFDCGFC